MITKERYFQKPTYKSLENSLKHMKEICIEFKINNLAMPKIGCGLDGLKWQQVAKIIDSIFTNSGINITIYIFK